MNITTKTAAAVLLFAAILGGVAAACLGSRAHAADTSLRSYARIVPGMTMDAAVEVFGMEAQVTVLSSGVIELAWFSPDYRECITVVFIDGKAIAKNRTNVTNEPALNAIPKNVGENK